MSFLGHVNRILHYRRTIVIVPLVTAIAAVTLTLLKGGDYVAESAFAPNEGERPGGLGGIAAQFGFEMPGSSGQGVDFYAALLMSRELLSAAALTNYAILSDDNDVDTISGTILDLYGIDRKVRQEGLLHAVKLLERVTEVEIAREVPLVRLRVTSPWGELAEQLNRRLLDLVDSFNLRQRQSSGRAEREFVEARVAVARDELAKAEAELEAFVNENRSYLPTSPTAFEAARLQRRVDLQQQVYLTLAQAYERARLEEVRNTPVITVLDSPEGSSNREDPLMFNAAMGLFLGGILALSIVFGREFMAGARAASPEVYAEFEELRRQTLSELSPRRMLGRKGAEPPGPPETG